MLEEGSAKNILEYLNNNNVKILHCAIGSERGLVNIENPEASKDSFRTNSNIIPGKDSIKMITISDIESEFPEAIPFVVKPNNIIPGVADYYATTIADGFDFANILVKTREGRPIKIEKNELTRRL